MDLIIAGGRVIDPANGRDEIADVAFADGRVAPVAAGGATILEIIEGDVAFRDALGKERRGSRCFAVRGLVVGGRRWPAPSA